MRQAIKRKVKARYSPRKCPHCNAVFLPQVRGGLQQRFCCPEHRKAYHQYGTLPFEKLMERIRKEIRSIVREELEDFRVRNVLTPNRPLVTESGNASIDRGPYTTFFTVKK